MLHHNAQDLKILHTNTKCFTPQYMYCTLCSQVKVLSKPLLISAAPSESSVLYKCARIRKQHQQRQAQQAQAEHPVCLGLRLTQLLFLWGNGAPLQKDDKQHPEQGQCVKDACDSQQKEADDV